MKADNLTVITISEPGIRDFATARNTALDQAKTEWVLYIDTDEALTPELEKEIMKAIESREFDAYYLPRQDKFMGRILRHGETGHAKFIRLARKSFGRWERPVHEIWSGEGREGELTHPIEHISHQTITSFLDKINTYSEIEAKYRYTQGIRSSIFKIAVYPVAKFKLNYLWRQGFRDGVPGMIMAIMMSFHSYLTWTKLYLLWKKN